MMYPYLEKEKEQAKDAAKHHNTGKNLPPEKPSPGRFATRMCHSCEMSLMRQEAVQRANHECQSR
jgi:23S rRNA maturation-related 3'-5' exoribonuclease YhaM